MPVAQTHNPKVDAYFAKVPPFAQPIMEHLRDLIHKGCPEVEETMKWSRPFFEYHGVILCNISAFKQHCSFGFWGVEMGDVLRASDALKPGAMGSLGRIASMQDLPPQKVMLGWIRQAAAFIDKGERISPIAIRHSVVKAPKTAPSAPPEFTAALQKNKKATAVFAAFAPSCQREYVEWIAEAKRPETREKRIASAIAWIAEGKQRHWKYQTADLRK